MDATAPVEPDMPWARVSCVKASKAAVASTEQATFDSIWFSFEIVSMRECAPHFGISRPARLCENRQA
jgi:hypothetical protein